MGTLGTATTMGTGVLWRATGSDRLAESLVRTAATDDEDSATVAVMMLTRGGAKAVPVVRDAIADGAVDLVSVLVGIGDDTARAALVELSSHPDSDVAAACQIGLTRLDRGRAGNPD